MNILIFGAGNSIATHIARYLYFTEHHVVFADTNRYARGFYSRFCRSKYRVRRPEDDTEGFFLDLKNCVNREAIDLIVPTSDQALLDILRTKDALPAKIQYLFPLDADKISALMDKRNIPSLCEKAGISTAVTCIIDKGSNLSAAEEMCAGALAPPYAIKPSRGHGGEGFRKVMRREDLEAAFKKVALEYPGTDYIIQKYVEGEVYGAGALFKENILKHFYLYKYIRRYPSLYGASTICQVETNDTIKKAMVKALVALEWHGYCHMDWIIDKISQEPLLIDINPVHWYAVPNSLAHEFNSLSYYLKGGRRNHSESVKADSRYSTVWLCRELHRIVSGCAFREKSLPGKSNYWSNLRALRISDFYWDPLPIVFAPFLNLVRSRFR